MSADRRKEEELKQIYKDDIDIRKNNKSLEDARHYVNLDLVDKANNLHIDTRDDTPYDIGTDYAHNKKRNDSKVNHKLHDKINNRAKMNLLEYLID